MTSLLVPKDSLSINTPMGEILDALPGARRALFASYHLGGCQSCGFPPEETLAELSKRAGDRDPDEMLPHLLDAHSHDQKMLISQAEAKCRLESENHPHLVDNAHKRITRRFICQAPYS